jgi:hypothetical protein
MPPRRPQNNLERRTKATQTCPAVRTEVDNGLKFFTALHLLVGNGQAN